MGRSIGFIMIPLYTHYLSTDQYGTLELLDLTCYVVGMLLGTGISSSVFRYYYNYDEEEKKKQVIGIAMIVLWFNSLIGLPLLFLFSKDISNLVFESQVYSRLFIIIFITTALNLINGIPRALMRIQKKSVLYVSITTIKLIINLTLNILFIVHYKMGIMGILLGGLLSSCAVSVFLHVFVFRHMRLSYSPEIVKGMMKFGIPLIGSGLGMFAMNFVDRFLLQRFASLSDVGIYALAYKFGMILNMLYYSPFMKVWRPMQFEMVKESDAKRKFSMFFTYFCFVGFFLALGVSVLVRDVIAIVADVRYHAAHQYVPLIIMAQLFAGAHWYVQFGILFEKKTKYLAYASIFGALLSISSNLLLIPRYQAWGAASATLISYVFFFLLTYYFGQKYYHIPYQFGRILKIVITALLLFIFAFFVNPENLAVSLVVKSLITLCFPLILYFLRFYTRDELQKFHQIRRRVWIGIKAKYIEK